MPTLTRLAANHRGPLADLLARTSEFTSDDIAVALELIDLGLAGSPDYRFWIALDSNDAHHARPVNSAIDAPIVGYICFGKTPMTIATYDLYWIAVDAASKGTGMGRALVRKMEDEIKAEGAHLVRVETAGLDSYDATRAFYDRIGYEVVARIRDFYARGNDLVIYGHYL